MATSNSTTIPSITDSSLPTSTNTTTTSTVSITSVTNIPATRSTDVGPSSDAWTTSIITFVTATGTYSTPTTSTLTTVVRISGASSSHSPTFRSLSAIDPLTRPTTETVTGGVPKSESTSTGISSKSQQPYTPALVVIGLVVASFTAGFFFLLCRRRRRRLRQKKVEYIFNRPESCLSFLDSDPFVSLPLNLAPAMRSTRDGDQHGTTRPVFDAMMSNWRDSESSGHGAFAFNPILHKPRSLDNDSSATLSSQYGTQRSSPCLPTSLFEQDEVICEGRSLEHYSIEKSLHEAPTLIPISHPPPPPPRPPRSLRQKSKRSTFDSVSTAHSSSASLLYRPSPEDRLGEPLY